MVGIYKITSPSGKIYVGSSKDIDFRKNQYRYLNCKRQTKLYNSLKKHSWVNHKFEILEECEISILLIRERYWGDFYNVLGKMGLNCFLPKIEDSKINVSEETKLKISVGNRGKTVSKESKLKMSVSKRNISDETRLKMSVAKQNMSEETRLKMSVAKRNVSDETKKRMAIAKTNHFVSEETKKKLKTCNKYKRKIILNNEIVFDSITEACRILNLGIGYVYSRLKKKYKGNEGGVWDYYEE